MAAIVQVIQVRALRRSPWTLPHLNTWSALLLCCSSFSSCTGDLKGPQDTADNTGTPQTEGTRVHAVVAHPDDDLLFMAVPLQAHLAAGHAVNLIFLTSGDAGNPDTAFWLAREGGVRAAYSGLLKVADSWQEDSYDVQKKTWTRFRLQGYAPGLSLLFLRLPDGLLSGTGSPTQHYQSLGNLWNSHQGALRDVQGGQTVSKEDLIATLAAMEADFFKDAVGVTVMRTLNCLPTEKRPHDHPDHRFAALFAVTAHQQAVSSAALYLHRGYDSTKMPLNLTQATGDLKWAVFSTYATYDPSMHLQDANWLSRTYYPSLRRREYAWQIVDGPQDQSTDFCALPTTDSGLPALLPAIEEGI